MAGNVSGQSNRSQSQAASNTNSSTKTHHSSEGQSARVRHRSPHGHHHHHHGHHAHSPHMEDIQKAELQARHDDPSKTMNGEFNRDGQSKSKAYNSSTCFNYTIIPLFNQKYNFTRFVSLHMHICHTGYMHTHTCIKVLQQMLTHHPIMPTVTMAASFSCSSVSLVFLSLISSMVFYRRKCEEQLLKAVAE